MINLSNGHNDERTAWTTHCFVLREIIEHDVNRGPATVDGGLTPRMLRLDAKRSDEHAEIRSGSVTEISDLLPTMLRVTKQTGILRLILR